MKQRGTDVQFDPCFYCEGTGLQVVWQDTNGSRQKKQNCIACEGTGRVPRE